MKTLLALLLMIPAIGLACVTPCVPAWEYKQIGSFNGVKLWRLRQSYGWLLFVETTESTSTGMKRDPAHLWNWNY